MGHEQDIPPGYGTAQDIDQWKIHGAPAPADLSHRSDGNEDGDEQDEQDDNRVDPTHECVHCGSPARIESETRRRAPHFCDECDTVTDHQRV